MYRVYLFYALVVIVMDVPRMRVHKTNRRPLIVGVRAALPFAIARLSVVYPITSVAGLDDKNMHGE